MAEDGAQNSSADDPQEPTLDDASPTAADAPSPSDTPAAPATEEKPAVSEEDEMLLALKQAIKPEKS